MSEQNQPDDPLASCLDAADVTPLERLTIQRLRTDTERSKGWWKGDPNALKVLREFARKVVEEQN